uniref:Uncharacterized protein n=1 Tax=Oryza rufipogon TaxID=4529 RepID=A0A0E0P8B9_ORYRU
MQATIGRDGESAMLVSASVGGGWREGRGGVAGGEEASRWRGVGGVRVQRRWREGAALAELGECEREEGRDGVLGVIGLRA